MKTLLIIVAFLLAGTYQADAFQEVFLMLNHATNAELHRIQTSNEFYSPIGFFLETEPAEAFYIDKIKNFRFYQRKPADKETSAIHFLAASDVNRISRQPWIPDWLRNNQALLKIKPLRVEVQKHECVESFWRGQKPGKALERIIGSFVDITGRHNSSTSFLEGNHAVFHFSDKDYTQGDIYYYSWWGRQRGKISKNLVSHEVKAAFESKDPETRFFGIEKAQDGLEHAFVVGTDILREWLSQHGLYEEAETALCSLASLTNDQSGKGLHICIYSGSNDKIFRFFARDGEVVAPMILDLTAKVDALLVDSHGNLYFSTRTAFPANIDLSSFNESNIETVQYHESPEVVPFEEDFACSGEELLPEQTFENISGNIILSQQFHQQTYLMMADSNQPQLLRNVNLEKKYFSVEFVFNNFSFSNFYNDWSYLLKQAEKPGNRLSPPSSGVEGFPDQYKEPESVFLAIY